MTDWRVTLRHCGLLAPLRLVTFVLVITVTLVGLVTWMTLFSPFFWICPRLYWTLAPFFRDTGFGMKGVIWWFMGYNVVEVGNVLEEMIDDKCLVLVNHQSMLDGPTLTAMVGQKGITDRCAFTIDAWMKYVTYYGYYALFGGDLFVQQFLPEDQRQKSLETLGSEVKYMFDGPAQRNLMLYFPEGGLLHKRRPRSQAFAKKYGHPVLEHVALPRTGALQTMLQAITTSPSNDTNQKPSNSKSQTGWKWIVDATIAYPNGKPLPISDLITGAMVPCLITVCYRVYPAAQVPLETDALQKWIFDRFVEKDAMLCHFYKHGCFPDECLTRSSELTVRTRPKPILWNSWSSSLGLVVASVLQFYTGVTVWRYIFTYVYTLFHQSLLVIGLFLTALQ